jgi:hypothetical protein
VTALPYISPSNSATPNRTTAWLDEKKLGEHQGGYTPFSFELPGVSAGQAQYLVVRVDDTPHPFKLFDRFDVNETLLWSFLPACFYLLGRHAADWKSAGELGHDTWPRAMRREDGPLPAWADVGYRLPPFIYFMRVLRPLTAFGLLEWRDTQGGSRLDIEYRVTSLFRPFLHFDELTLSRPLLRHKHPAP